MPPKSAVTSRDSTACTSWPCRAATRHSCLTRATAQPRTASPLNRRAPLALRAAPASSRESRARAPSSARQPGTAGVATLTVNTSYRNSDLVAAQQHDGLRGDALRASEEPQALGGGRLDVDALPADLQQLCNLASHGLAIGGDLRRLREHREVYVSHGETPCAQQREHARDEASAVGAFPLRVGVTEMVPDVAH